MFAKLAQIRANDRILYTLVQVALFEIYYLYWGINSFVQEGVQNSQLIWSQAIIKIILGFVVYKLYTVGSKKLAASGAFLALAILATLYVTYVVNPNGVSRILGGIFFFVISLNTFFLIRYLRHPELIFQPTIVPNEFSAKPAFQALMYAVILLWVTLSPSGIMQTAILLGWISCFLATEGVWVGRQR